MNPEELTAFPAVHTQDAGTQRSSPHTEHKLLCQLHFIFPLQVQAEHICSSYQHVISRDTWQLPQKVNYTQTKQSFSSVMLPCQNCSLVLLFKGSFRSVANRNVLKVLSRYVLRDLCRVGKAKGITMEGKGADWKAGDCRDFCRWRTCTHSPPVRPRQASSSSALSLVQTRAQDEPACGDKGGSKPLGKLLTNQPIMSTYYRNWVSSTWFQVSMWTVFTTPRWTGKLTWLLQEHVLAKCSSGTLARKACREMLFEHFMSRKDRGFSWCVLQSKWLFLSCIAFDIKAGKNPKNDTCRFSLWLTKCTQFATWLRWITLLKILLKSSMAHNYTVKILIFSEILVWKHFLIFFQRRSFSMLFQKVMFLLPLLNP